MKKTKTLNFSLLKWTYKRQLKSRKTSSSFLEKLTTFWLSKAIEPKKFGLNALLF